MHSPHRDHTRCFGVFEVELGTGALRKSGFKVRLPEQSFQILVLLLERPGELISRDQIKRRLWPAGTYVDFDHGVNKAINRLRQALGDSGSNSRFIESLRGRGYRFIAPVSVPEAQRQYGTHNQLRLAVFPFQDLGCGKEQDCFAEGLTEELTVQLGQIHPERMGVVASRAAVMQQQRDGAITQVAAELNLSHWVAGSIRRFADRIRISVQLIDQSSQTQLWAENYERSLRDVFAVQSEVAQVVSQVVAFKLLAKPEQGQTAFPTQTPNSVSALENQKFSRNPLRPV